MRIVLISDTHLAPSADAFRDNATAAIAWIEAHRPDLVVHLGDVTADGVCSPAQFPHAARLLSAISAPLLAVPGNHDVGDCPPGGGVKEPGLDLARLADFRAALGADRWSLRVDGWLLIGLNSQVFGSGGDEEADQALWLDAAAAEGDEQIALFIHKPLLLDDEPLADHPRFAPLGAARRMREALAHRNVRLVASGHVHQWRERTADATTHVWAPSAAFVIPDSIQERIGEKVVGLAVLELAGQDLGVSLAVPRGMAAHDILDYPEVYPQVAALRPPVR